MKLSLNWLQDFLVLSDLAPSEIANRLTLSSCELEGAWKSFSYLDHIQVAVVVSVDKHPNADRLSLCRIKGLASDRELQIVCGAQNVQPQMLVALAPIGSKLPRAKPLDIEQEFWEIRPAKIRGIESQGMLCSASELGLEAIVGAEEGILDLGKYFKGLELANVPIAKDKKSVTPCKPGTPLSKLFPLKDFIFEVDHKSITHRPDLWSHYGFARELSAIFCRNLHFNPLNFELKKINRKLTTKEIHIAKDAALSYYGLSVSGVQIKPAPLWMQARLLNIGQQPINNVVDASNYVMFDIGQPNHAFDARQLKTKTISVAIQEKKKAIESFTTLDGQERLVPDQSILIFDGLPSQKKVVALAGIMGGLAGKVEDDTTELFLESATFPRANIRKTTTKLNLRTESAQRFEKGQDPAQAVPALYRLAQLLKHSCPQLEVGKLCGKMLVKPKRNRISVSLGFLHKRLGFAMPLKQAKGILERLNFQVELKTAKKKQTKSKKKKSQKTLMLNLPLSSPADELILKVQAPTYRSQYDIQIAEDLVEELGRIYGYDNIKPQNPIVELSSLMPNHKRELGRRIRQYLSNCASFTETYNYSFASSENNRFWPKQAITLQNPVFEHKNELRVHLLPGLLQQAAQNQDRFGEIRLFEMDRIYWLSTEKSDSQINGFVTGNNHPLQTRATLKTDGKFASRIIPNHGQQHEADSKTEPLPLEENRLTLVMMPPIPTVKADKKANKDILFSYLLSFRQKMEFLLTDILSSHLDCRLLNTQDISEEWLPLHPGASVIFCYQPEGKRKFSINNKTNKQSNIDKEDIIGRLGILHPTWESKFGIKRPVLVGDFNLDKIYTAYEQTRHHFKYHPPSIYPLSYFEISLLLPIDSSSYTPVEIIYGMNIKEIESVRYLTEYRGPPLKEDQKSISYEITCGRSDATLKGDEIQKILDKIVAHLATLGFPLRS